MSIFKFRNLTTGQAMPIPPGEFTVGRDDAAYVHVVDGSVSRKHAKVSNTDEGFFVEDIGSSNGTAIRGALIKGRAKVEFGDVVHIGSVPFRIDPEVGGEPTPVVAASAGMRPVNRSYLSRDTERIKIPLAAELTPSAVTSATSKLALPVVEESAPAPTPVAMEAAAGPAPEAAPVLRGALPFGKNAPARPGAASSAAAPKSSGAKPGTVATAPPKAETAPKPAGGKSTTVVFLAGLAIGLLAGLLLAMLFFSMGGKAAGIH